MTIAKRAVGRMGLSGNLRVYSSTSTKRTASSASSAEKPSSLKNTKSGKLTAGKRRSKSA
jgi:hypothetical protein